MRIRIAEVLPEHELIEFDSEHIYIADFKNHDLGKVRIFAEPPEIKYVYLENSKPTKVVFDGFEENCLPTDNPSNCSSQCECVLFPATCAAGDWVLFIETKYANDIVAAFRENRDYPNSAINQIIATVTYFRDKQILPLDKRVNAIVSFPNLIEEFNSTFFTGSLSAEDILQEHRILIRATNSALIKSEKRIVLNSI